MKGETMLLKRKLAQRKCGFKSIVSTAQFQVLGKVDEFLMTDLGLIRDSAMQPNQISQIFYENSFTSFQS